MLLPCDSGPSQSRLEYVSPRLEIEEPDGTYVLVDEGEPYEWHYLFIPHRH